MGDRTFCRKTICRKTICQKTICRKTICRKTICRRTFGRKTLCRRDILSTDILPIGHFTEKTFCRIFLLMLSIHMYSNFECLSAKYPFGKVFFGQMSLGKASFGKMSEYLANAINFDEIYPIVAASISYCTNDLCGRR